MTAPDEASRALLENTIKAVGEQHRDAVMMAYNIGVIDGTLQRMRPHRIADYATETRPA